MTDLHIPDYADLLRRAAANHAADATRYADCEQKLTTELTRFEEWMHGEHARIQAELNEAQAKAEEQLRAIAQDWETRKRDLREAGRQKTEHQRHATGAERSWRNWCHDEGVDPDTVPPLTGPLPAIPAPVPRDVSGDPFAIPANRIGEPAPLPALDDPDALLALGQRMADPLTTRVDPLPAGGDEPGPGPFPDGDTQGPGMDQRADLTGVNDPDGTPATGDEQDGDGDE